MKTITDILKERLGKAMQEQSLNSIAKAAGVSQPALYRWLNGQQQTIGLDIADRLALHFGLSLRPAPQRKG